MSGGPKGMSTYLVKKEITWWQSAFLEGAASKNLVTVSVMVAAYLLAPAEVAVVW